jgi:hypothetical protein
MSSAALGPTQLPIQWVIPVRSLRQSGRCVKMTTCLHAAASLEMAGAIPSFRHIPHDAQSDNFNFLITISIYTQQHNNVFMLLYYPTTCFGHWPSLGRGIKKS